ncbi:MAG: hypothetical protein AB1473_02985 [Thermodesulfobacteriota bacterium]
MPSDCLFSKVDVSLVQEDRKRRVAHDVAVIDGTRLLNTSIDDLCSYLEQEYRINVPVLREHEILADQHETEIHLTLDECRRRGKRRGPFSVTGTAVEITVPFDGDAEVFKMQPTTYTLDPPFGEVKTDKLVLRVAGTDMKPAQVKGEINRMISDIKEHLETLRKDVLGFNNLLRVFAHKIIQQRRDKLLADLNLVAALGFPLKERNDQSRTYVAPQVRRRITPTLPPASTAPFKPEPTLSIADYNHILNVINNMAQVMELSPSAFATMDEETLRFHFLVQLNGHYEGQATGETFNYEGKTDILIRVEGKNIFIAECKYWGGPKRLTKTIDQVLSYSSWRDTKVAVIIFNRRKNFSAVLDAIPSTVEAHSNFKRAVDRNFETNFQYIFSHRDDRNREMLLTVLAFDVPG